MATDYNNKAVLGKPAYVGSAKNSDLPLDARTRIDTIADLSKIEFPFIGMIFYVVDEDAYYSVKTLKGEEKVPGIAATFVPNLRVDQYEPFSGGAAPDKETVIEACDPSDPDAKTVVADEADPFDPETQIKVSDANAKAAEGVTFSPGDTVKEVEVTKPAVDLSEITARIEHLESLHGATDEPGYEVVPPGTEGAKEVVADDADPFDPDTQIKISDANKGGGSANIGDFVKPVESEPVDLSDILARLDALEKATGTDTPSYKPSTDGTGLTVVADDKVPFDPETEIKVSDANANGGNFQPGDKVVVDVKPEDGVIKPSTNGSGLTVVADDKVPFDPETEIKVSDANKDGGNFQPGDKVVVDPKPSLEDRVAALEEKMNEVKPDPLPITFDAYLGTVDSSGTESLTKYTVNKPGAGEAYEFPVNMTSAAKVVIEYPQSIGALVSISDTNTGMELIDGFTQTTTTRASVAHYRYTLNNTVVLKDSFLFYWSK